MNRTQRVEHAMMSFALMGGLLVSPRPKPERREAPRTGRPWRIFTV